ncbi:MAG TPA: DUF3019 domain-containing protein [Steroidobacteraceae bacterium]|nr:DUF3019 domain-containing protein [Steroidobacteraceae bacterium]
MQRRRPTSGSLLYALLAVAPLAVAQAPAQPPVPRDIELDVKPRVCTLAAEDESCDTVVSAQWRARSNESVCVLVVGRPEIRRCWENHSEGLYTVALVFSEDLVVELRDTQEQRLLASEAIRVIREALQLRRKRRPPWSIFH